MLWLKTLVFTLIAPGVITGLIPYLLLDAKARSHFSGWDLSAGLGLIAAAAGFAIYLWCAADFVRKGRGTPAPYDPPKALVVRGLYRFVRNPMYLGVMSILLGEAIFFRVDALWVYAALVLLAFHLRVLWYEEPTLRRLFGESYAEYCAEVPRWMPKFRSMKSAHVRDKLLHLTFSMLLAAGSSACEFQWPKAAPPMATAKFAQVYVGLLQATVGDSLAPARADSVFQAHSVARKDFAAASQYYSEKAEQWGEVLKLVVAQLDSQMAKETRNVPQD